MRTMLGYSTQLDVYAECVNSGLTKESENPNPAIEGENNE